MADSHGGTVDIRVFPKARKSGLRGLRDGRVLYGVFSPPEDGKANDELVRGLSKILGVPKSSISVTTGSHAREKTLSVAGLSSGEIMAIIEGLLPPGGNEE